MLLARVHPRFVVPYFAFYLEGLGRVLGFDNIVFDRDGGPEPTEFDDGFAFTLVGSGAISPRFRRIYINANDFSRIDSVALEWCDRFGVINYDPSVAQETHHPDKVVAIGPSFGIRGWGGVRRTLRDLVRIWRQLRLSPRRQITEVRHVFKLLTERVTEESYSPSRARDGYVFSVAWPWKKHPDVNPPRARFMRACKAARGVTFEGGFAPRRRRDVEGIDDVLAARKYPFREYLENTKASAVVFNCPAVHGCLGWKLGEFLALGKAVLSLPLSRSMPEPLVHGENVHFVEDDQDAMRSAVERITRDRRYRERLELGARRYYLEHLAPERVIRRLVGA
jgi:hypothetical protein